MIDTSRKVLVIMPLVPHPQGNGSQKRAAAHLAALVETNAVHLLVFDSTNSGGGKSGDDRLLALCESVSIVQYRWRSRPEPVSTPPFPTLSEIFYPTIKRRLPSADDIRTAFAHTTGQQFDAVLCFKLISAMIFDYAQSVVPIDVGRKVVDFDDIQSIADQRALVYEKRGFEQSIIDSLVRRQIRLAEERCLQRYDAVWICSETDRCQLMLRKPGAAIHVIPNSIALFDPAPQPVGRQEVNMLFVGTLSYGPNEDGIIWFCHEILPLIKASTSHKIVLRIVGFNPPAAVNALEVADEIIVTGCVESVSPFYDDCDIVIAPIRFGGGTRLKILEAMSHQRPVVSTTLGVEGIDAVPGESIMIGDTPKEFAESCLRLIADFHRRCDIAMRGRALVEANYVDNIVAKRTRLAM